MSEVHINLSDPSTGKSSPEISRNAVLESYNVLAVGLRTRLMDRVRLLDSGPPAQNGNPGDLLIHAVFHNRESLHFARKLSLGSI